MGRKGIPAAAFGAQGFHDMSRYQTGRLCRVCRHPTMFGDDLCATCQKREAPPAVIAKCLRCGETWPSGDGRSFRCGFCGSGAAEPTEVRP